MERKDVKIRPIDEYQPNDEVTLSGNGREAELIVAGLKVLQGQIGIRDAIVEHGQFNNEYPTGSQVQNGGVPLAGEVERLIIQIGEPHYGKVTPHRNHI